MPEFNPNQLVLAREARGLTQGELSDRIPVLNQGNLSKIERGVLGVTSSTLETIAKALHYPVSFFYQEDRRPEFSNLYYRKRYTVNGKSLKQLRLNIQILTRAIGNIMEEVDLQKKFEKLRFDVADFWTPEKAAIQTREYLGIPETPLRNIVSYLEAAGIIVYFLNYDVTGFDGVTAVTDNGWPVIFINNYQSNDRKKMSLAHELGHVTQHIHFVLEPYRDEEKEAKEFASEFLLPSHLVKADLINLGYHKLDALKEYWQVSKAALVYKAHKLGLIDKSKNTYLNIELGRRGERKVERGYVDIDSPTLLKKIIGLYKNDLKYSVEDLAAMTNLYPDEFIKYFDRDDSEPRIKRLFPKI